MSLHHLLIYLDMSRTQSLVSVYLQWLFDLHFVLKKNLPNLNLSLMLLKEFHQAQKSQTFLAFRHYDVQKRPINCKIQFLLFYPSFLIQSRGQKDVREVLAMKVFHLGSYLTVLEGNF